MSRSYMLTKTKAIQYPAIRLHENKSEDTDISVSANNRIPWDVLVKLFESAPFCDQDTGDFAFVVLRLKELHDEADAWQEEVSKLTMISLRGGKKRSTPSKSLSPLKFGEGGEQEESSMLELEKVTELSNDPILTKVAMPREIAVKNMLRNTERFEALLYEFLGKDYDGESPDRAPFPKSDSLVGEDGRFILFRLTFSPLFQNLKSSIASIAEVADNVFANTPGKATFDWIRQAVAWIESLHGAVRFGEAVSSANRLVIDVPKAIALVKSGEELFVSIPDDLRRTLSEHRIFISSNKEGRMMVKSKKGGAHNALGVMAIRWCPVLFESLKSDLMKSEKWEEKIVSLSTCFTQFVNSTQDMTRQGDDSIVVLHNFREDISDLLEDSQDLVVMPSPAVLEHIDLLLQNLDLKLQSCSNGTIFKKFLDERFSYGGKVVESRSALLDSLLNRLSVSQKPSIKVDETLNKTGPFRSAARALMERALRKALVNMDVDVDSDDASTFLSLKAWEIETALFDLYQATLGETTISNEYRDKARALKRSLEDSGNIFLIARVLADQIDVSQLVAMSIEELANPQTKETRAKAAAAAKQNSLLTSGTQSQGQQSSPEKKPGASRSKSGIPHNGDHIELAAESKNSVDSSKSRTSLGETMKNTRINDRPIAPPSLVSSLRSSVQSSKSGVVSGLSGGDRFLIYINGASVNFAAGFNVEKDPHSLVHLMIPEELSEKGRIRPEEFEGFFAGKIDSPHWGLIVLKLVPLSDRDEREFNKFCRDYERRNRIAMFTVRDKDKMYLLTPKFHHAARNVRLENKNNTYGIILARRS